MVAIRIKKGPNKRRSIELGERICEALKGNKAFIESDILVNYDADPDFVIVCLGENNDRDLTLNFDWPSGEGSAT